MVSNDRARRVLRASFAITLGSLIIGVGLAMAASGASMAPAVLMAGALALAVVLSVVTVVIAIVLGVFRKAHRFEAFVMGGLAALYLAIVALQSLDG